MKISNLLKLNLFWLLGTVAWGMNSSSQNKSFLPPEDWKNLQDVVKSFATVDEKKFMKLYESPSELATLNVNFGQLPALLNKYPDQKTNILKHLASKGIGFPFIDESFLKDKDEGGQHKRLDYLDLARQNGSYAARYLLSYWFYVFCDNAQDKIEAFPNLFDAEKRPIFKKKFEEISQNLLKGDDFTFHWTLAENHISCSEFSERRTLGLGSVFFEKMSQKGFGMEEILNQPEFYPWEILVLSSSLGRLAPEHRNKNSQKLLTKLGDFLVKNKKDYDYSDSFLKCEGIISLSIYYLAQACYLMNQFCKALEVIQIREEMPSLMSKESLYIKSLHLGNQARAFLQLSNKEKVAGIIEELKKMTKKPNRKTVTKSRSQHKKRII